MTAHITEHPSIWRRLVGDPAWLSSVAAVLIGVSALSVSVYQASIMREQQRMSVWPHVTLWSSNVDASGKPVYLIELRNDGVGPAKLQSLEVLVDGLPVRSWDEAIAKLTPKVVEGKPGETLTSTLHNRVLPAGDKATGLQLRDGWRVALLEKERARVRIRYCYCSIYNDCTLSDEGRADEQQPVEACPAPTLPFEG